MTSIDDMSETEAREYIRAEITALRPILGGLIPRSGTPFLMSGNEEGALEYLPSLAVTPSTNSQKRPLSGY